MAAKLKLTAALQQKLVRLVRSGVYVDKARAAAGISRQTFYNWLDRGAEGDGEEPYATFALVIERARAETQAKLLQQIAKRVHNWQALSWILERSDPDHWGQRQRTTIEIEKHGDERVEALLDRLKERDAEKYAWVLSVLAEEEPGAGSAPSGGDRGPLQ